MPRRSSSRGSGFSGRSGGGRSYSTGRGASPGYRSSSSGSYGSTRPSGNTRNMYNNPSSSNPNFLTSKGPGMGLGTAMATGMAFGGGSALAHHAIGGIMGRGPYASPSENYPISGSSENVQSNLPMDYGVEELRKPVTQEELVEQQMKTNPCYDYNVKFVSCLKDNFNDIAKCQNVFDDMLSCEKSLMK
jgi:hypothetical protein